MSDPDLTPRERLLMRAMPYVAAFSVGFFIAAILAGKLP